MQRSSYIFSASLHAGITALAIFGLPYWEPKREPEPPVILAEFAPIADKTNVPKPQPKVVESKAEPKEEPVPEQKPTPEPPKPQPQAVAPPPPPPPPAPEPPRQAEAPKPAPMPEPVPSPKPVPKPKDVVETPEPPKVAEKPKPEAKPAPPKTTQRTEEKSKAPSFTDVAALVNKMKAPPAAQPQQAPQTAARTPPASAPRAEGPSNPNLPISMSEKDFIRKQVEDKWQFDIGAKDASNLQVRIRFSLNPDGTLRTQPEIVDQARMYLPGQESYRSAAESARRAVLKAVPFQLPPGDKDKWGQDIILHFDPRQMLGG
ncbi:MAG: hypothetical protein ACK4FK_16660 [Ferrovibrio sp.]|uniref:hypothetical protein n=1 Tax=Ferrovibrio sp. TaxID=1917215 RepID=UPI00391A9323